MVSRKPYWFLPILLVFFVLSSCASLQTQVDHYEDINKQLSRHNYKKAVEKIEKAKEEGKYEKKDRVLYYLDMGIALHNAGEFKESNKYLSAAERTIEDNFTKSISKLATSMILNDNVLDYPGEDYEDIFTNILMALNYIHLDNIEDAMVEVRRIDVKLSKLQDKYRGMAEELSNTKENIKFKVGETDLRNSALGSYLSMISYYQLGKIDDARIDKRRVERATHGNINSYLEEISKYPEDNRIPVYLLSFTGMGPVKKPLTLSLDLDPDLDLGMITIPGEENTDMIFRYKGDKELHFKFAVPRISDRETRITKVRILVNGRHRSEMKLLEDFEYVARKTFDVKKPIIYLRSGVRTFLKAMADAKAKEEIDKKTKDKKDLLGAVLKFAVDKLTDITENADLRCWRTMPGCVYTERIELKPGKYNIVIEYLNRKGKVIDREIFENIQISDNKLNLIEGVSYL